MNEKTTFIFENNLGSIQFAYDSPFWLDIPDISSVGIDIAATRGRQQVGTTIISQSVQPKSFTIDGAIFDPLDENRNKLLHIFAPRVKSTLTMIEGDEEWYLNVVPETTPVIDGGNGVQHFQVTLYASYPYWQLDDMYIRQVAGLTPKFKFPFYTGGSWYISTFSDNYYATINNSGNVPSSVQITFAARRAVENPEVMNMESGKKIAIKKAMAPGEKMIVSTFYGAVGAVFVDDQGNESNGWKYLSIDSDLSFDILPGNNLIRGDAKTNRSGMSIRLEAPRGVKSGV